MRRAVGREEEGGRWGEVRGLGGERARDGEEEGKNVWRKRKGGDERGSEEGGRHEREPERKAKREWWTTVRSRPVARRLQ